MASDTCKELSREKKHPMVHFMHTAALADVSSLASSATVGGPTAQSPTIPASKYSKMAPSATLEKRLAHSIEQQEIVTPNNYDVHRLYVSSHHPDASSVQLNRNALGRPPTPPPRSPPESISDRLIHAKQTWSLEKEKILLAPYDYLCQRPGKDVRTQIIQAFNAWLKVPEDRLEVITKVVGMLHTSSLLVDDVEDFSTLRRGAPVAHSIFGVPQVINSANYVYFQALEELLSLNNPACIQIFTEELLDLHRGQGMDLYWRDSLTCPTEEDYLEMVTNKTGGLFRLAVKLMEAESSLLHPDTSAGAERDCSNPSTITNGVPVLSCVPLINTIGMHFQILDDLLNLCSTVYHQRKGHAEDLTEGKFSFPIIHAVRADPSNMVLLNILRQKTTDNEVKRYAVEYMEQMGSFVYTKKVIARLERKALLQVASLEERIGGPDGKDGGHKIRVILGKLRAL